LRQGQIVFESFERNNFPGQSSEGEQLSLVSLTMPHAGAMRLPAEIDHALWTTIPNRAETNYCWTNYAGQRLDEDVRPNNIGRTQNVAPAHQESKGEHLYHYLTQKYHLTSAQACGIIGNMQTESGLRSDARNHGEGAIGLCQWEGVRSKHLKEFAVKQGRHHTDLHTQVDFMMNEFKGCESFAWSALRRAHTPQQAALAFDRYYERSSGAARHQRMTNAANIYHQVTKIWS
jgi:tail lysozyme